MVFAGDDDADASTDVTFSDVRIFESTGTLGESVDYALSPVSDSYVRGGTFSTTNFGTEDSLVVKATGSSEFNRLSLIQFDVSGLASDANYADLILTVKAVGNEFNRNSRPISVYVVSDDSWTETGVTWANRPTIGSSFTSLSLLDSDVGNQIVIDVTEAVNAQRLADGTLTLAIYQPANSTGLVSFGSRESNTPPIIEVNGGN